MENRQLLEEMKHEVLIKADGATLAEAVGKVFQIMRKQIFKEIGKPIIQMEADQVFFENVDVHRTTERFLFLFWPREKVCYTITAKVVVNVKYLNITEEEL